MYNIIHIPTGQLVCYFDPQQLSKDFLHGSQHRRPRQFFLDNTAAPQLNELTRIPDWVIRSIQKPGRMKKRLLEGIETFWDTKPINRRSTKVYIEDFKFIKLE
jgi:hypothetical protein